MKTYPSVRRFAKIYRAAKLVTPTLNRVQRSSAKSRNIRWRLLALRDRKSTPSKLDDGCFLQPPAKNWAATWSVCNTTGRGESFRARKWTTVQSTTTLVAPITVPGRFCLRSSNNVTGTSGLTLPKFWDGDADLISRQSRQFLELGD